LNRNFRFGFPYRRYTPNRLSLRRLLEFFPSRATLIVVWANSGIAKESFSPSRFVQALARQQRNKCASSILRFKG
jgi:hypothetical protein